jgi:hypothetical protein
MDTEFRWERRIHQLKQFREANGHCNVPEEYANNKPLARWVSKQRSRYQPRQQGKKSKLTDDNIAELESMGFVWNLQTSNPKQKIRKLEDAYFDQRVQELKAYRETTGHCRVPFLYEPNKALGYWVSKVRTQYTWRGQGKKTWLTDAHISELDGLGFVWNAGIKNMEGLSGDELWKKRVEQLIEYRATNGHCRVPVHYKPNEALGTWVSKVRTKYKLHCQGKTTSFTDAHISELDSLGFVWRLRLHKNEDLTNNELWKKRIQELIEYFDTNGHCRVPFLDEPNKTLGNWVNRVRTQYTYRGQGKKTLLTDAHISELDDLGFVWRLRNKEYGGLSNDELWKTRVQELKAYCDMNGHYRVPAQWQPNKTLGSWVNNLRTQYTYREQGKKSCLTDARISELDDLGFVWKAGTRKKKGLVVDELRKQGEQNVSGISASQEKPLNSIDQDAAPPIRTISPASVPFQGAPRNVLPQSSTAMLLTNNHITFNPSPASNAEFKDSKKLSFEDGMEEMFLAMRAEEKRREDEEVKARQSNTQHGRKANMVWLL